MRRVRLSTAREFDRRRLATSVPAVDAPAGGGARMKKGTRSEALVVETPFPAVNLSTERFNPRILGSNLSVETDEGEPRNGRSLLLF